MTAGLPKSPASGLAVARRGDFIWALAGAAAMAIGGFAFVWATARLLGVSGAGFVLAFASWFTLIFTVGRFGFDTALVWMLPRSIAGAEEVNPSRFVRWAIYATVPSSAVLGLLLLLLAGPLSRLMFGDSFDGDYLWLVRLGALLWPAAVATVILLAALRGVGRVRDLVAVDQILRPVGRLVAVAIVVPLAGASVSVLVLCWLVVIPVSLLVAAWQVHRQPLLRGEVTTVSDVALRQGRSSLRRFAVPRIGAQLADAASLAVGTAVLASLSSTEQVGVFGTALRVVVSLTLTLWAMRIVIAPVFSYHLSRSDTAAAQRVYSAATQLIVLGAWPAALLLVVAPELALWVFGPGFAEGAAALRLLLLGVLLMASLGNLQAVVLMSGSSSAVLRATLAGLFANAAVCLGLVPAWGAPGAAAGWSIGVAFEAAVLLWAVREIGVRPMPRPVMGLLLVTAGLLVPGFIVAATVWQGSHVAAAVAIAAVVLVGWAAAVWRRGLAAWRALSAERTVG